MSRRSTDTDPERGRERGRDNYGSSSSYDPTRSRQYEPGEVRGRDGDEERLDGPTSRRARSPRKKERIEYRDDRSPRNKERIEYRDDWSPPMSERDKDRRGRARSPRDNERELDRKEVTSALEGFSKSAIIL